MSITMSSQKCIPQTAEIEHNPLTMSDEQILDQIYSTHYVHSDTRFDVDSLFTLAENTLRRSTHIVDNVVQGSNASLEYTDDKIPQFNSPLCILKKISFEMSCKKPGEEIAHKTTKAILSTLSNYAWDAKAVLTLAAFALDYGEFWLLAQHQPTDPLAKSVAVLKRVSLFTRPSAIQKHYQAIVEVNNLVKATLEVIKVIFELEKLASNYNTKDVSALWLAIEQIPVHVYWAITTIVALVTQIHCLTTEFEHKQELSHYGQKIKITLNKIRKQITLCKQQIDEVEYCCKLWKIFHTPTEIMEAFKALIVKENAPSLIDGANDKQVDITELRRKNVYLFISSLSITEEEISILQPVYDSIKTNNQYKIVWIPIVEEWTEKMREKFNILKRKMSWYVVQHFESIAGYKFIKEEWHFKKTPMVVVLNPQTKVQNTNAFHLIHAYGMKAFPFRAEDGVNISKLNYIGSSVCNIDPNINTWFEKEKYIFFYGGNDNEWIQQFTKYATALVNDAFVKEAKISIELCCVEKEDRSIVRRFWRGIESLFVTKFYNTVDTVTQEVQKLLSYKNETGWALLSKGSSVVVSGNRTTILKTVAEFEKWNEIVIKKDFGSCFKEYHEKIVAATPHRCSRLEIPNVAGNLPEIIECPLCPRTMDIFISYKCCHE